MKSWNKLAKYCTGKSSPGYTHQWKDKKFARWSKRLMASTHNLQENELAHSMGWRTFRTVMDISDKGEREIICPASAEGGYKADCMTCGACNGRKSLEDMRHNVVIIAHGSGYKPQLMQPLMKNEN
jgi:hypothetical protein